MGGTEFNEAGSPQYWNSGNFPNGSSALGYIPEVAWNETSPTGGIAASGGGPSAYYAKPAWQNGPGVPDDGFRDTPDVALSAALHDAYLVQQGTALLAVGGTSAAAPSFAGILAILNQYERLAHSDIPARVNLATVAVAVLPDIHCRAGEF